MEKDAILSPSGEKFMSTILSVCPDSIYSYFSVLIFQSLIVLQPDATWIPSGEKLTE